MRPSMFWSAITTLFATSLVSASSIHRRHCHNNIGKCNFHPSNSPKCWGDHSLTTNWYDEIPDTGVTREYWLQIQNGTAAVDGVERIVLTVNGSVPGPTITADWGDNVIVHVHNALENNGTSIHWHGLRQNYTTQNDGVASITQCPVAPGDSITYKFRAEQYGHSWYHSHFATQAWNGVFGGIVIHGPCSAPYDEDKGVLFLNDWFHNTTDALWSTASAGSPPPAQNGLINGTNIYGSGGKRFETIFSDGKRHRIRLVNGAIDTHYKFMIDNHKMKVIAADLVPIKPYTTEVLSIGIGQRYDIIVEADQGKGDFWLRAYPDMACSAQNEMADDIRGIIRYDTSSSATPTSTPYPYTEDCHDEPMSKLVPYVPLDVSSPTTKKDFNLSYTSTTTGMFKWTLDGTDLLSDWGVPTLQQSLLDTTVFKTSSNVVELNEKDAWVYFVIENGAAALGLTHPIHLHGHDFFVLAQEANANYTATTPLQLTNPPRRDVAMLPANGFLVIGFVTDNPGVWLMHCHIGWHASQGFGLQVVEREAEIPPLCDTSSIDSTCAKWQSYVAAKGVLQDDSGI
ncbi:putative multicopper oxidase [Annulohypoxylon maeteangense]|uniref:putative multicopper oxidase n=1 Tax=Annulohypoxylon maeteangense TaxID=1927788 RepID=UPI0020082232|nr:putative multicopper oxidase [Annulohypoxylon maeteangense]KAI0884968.1 putative multicopper oxidase [Annulohypoxylon maeteangense]